MTGLYLVQYELQDIVVWIGRGGPDVSVYGVQVSCK